MPPPIATWNELGSRQTAFEPADAASPNVLPPAESSLVAASQPQDAVTSASINTIIALTVMFGVVFIGFALFVIYWLYMRRLMQHERELARAEDRIWPDHRLDSREDDFGGGFGDRFSAAGGSRYDDRDIDSGYSPKPNPPLRMPSSSSRSNEDDAAYSEFIGGGNEGCSASRNHGTRGYTSPFTTSRAPPKFSKHQHSSSSSLFSAEFVPSTPRKPKPPHHGPRTEQPWRNPGVREMDRSPMKSKSAHRQSQNGSASSDHSRSPTSNAPPHPYPYPPPPEVDTVDGTAGGSSRRP